MWNMLSRHKETDHLVHGFLGGREVCNVVQDTERTMIANISHKQGITRDEQKAKTLHRKMLCGDVQGAVRYLTERKKGGILLPGDINEKWGNAVSKVLESKHPAARTSSTEALQTHPELPEFPDLDITEDSVEKVASRRLSGAAGLGGTDDSSMACFIS
jgi:hypothetical protein